MPAPDKSPRGQAAAGIQSSGGELDSRLRGNDDVALLPGWHTIDARAPHLLGARCKACGTYYFPKMVTFCRNPACNGEAFEEVPLSRTGTLWSWTNACYAPPEPFIAAEPHEPFAIAAVELERERMIVLGACAKGVTVEQLRAGMAMELALEALADGKLTWKWRPSPLAPLPQAGEGKKT